MYYTVTPLHCCKGKEETPEVEKKKKMRRQLIIFLFPYNNFSLELLYLQFRNQ